MAILDGDKRVNNKQDLVRCCACAQCRRFGKANVAIVEAPPATNVSFSFDLGHRAEAVGICPVKRFCFFFFFFLGSVRRRVCAKERTPTHPPTHTPTHTPIHPSTHTPIHLCTNTPTQKRAAPHNPLQCGTPPFVRHATRTHSIKTKSRRTRREQKEQQKRPISIRSKKNDTNRPFADRPTYTANNSLTL